MKEQSVSQITFILKVSERYLVFFSESCGKLNRVFVVFVVAFQWRSNLIQVNFNRLTLAIMWREGWNERYKLAIIQIKDGDIMDLVVKGMRRSGLF